MRNKLSMALLTTIIWTSILLSSAQADPITPSEYQVKAAFIYNFAKFVEWPGSFDDGRPFVIGILGRDPFGSMIDDEVAGKTIREKPIQIRRFSKIDDAAASNILYVSRSEAENVGQIVKRLGHMPILTVSDIESFPEQGGMVELLMEQNRVRFAINVVMVERAGLKPSSHLLKLARIVPGGGADRGFPSYYGFADTSGAPMRIADRPRRGIGMIWLRADSPSSVQRDKEEKL